MSGHNKWSKVKHIKGPLDAKRGKLFTKLIKEITIAARIGGGNPDTNARLRQAINTAKGSSMPKENIERAVKRGTGELEGETIDEVMYEGYGPGGVALIIEVTTDNKNRTVNDLRSLFKVHGGNLGEAGSVAWMFSHLGQIQFDTSKYPEDKIMEMALEVGAQDIKSAGDGIVDVLTSPVDVYRIKEAFEKIGFHPSHVGFSYAAKTMVPLDKASAEKLLPLLDEVDDHDDVQRVHSNAEIDDKIVAELNP